MVSANGNGNNGGTGADTGAGANTGAGASPGTGAHKINSLRDLPRGVEPAHDLWPGIEARLAKEVRRSAPEAGSSEGASPARSTRMRLIAAAAMIACLAIGVWIGRSVLAPTGHSAGADGLSASTSTGSPEAVHAAYVNDPRYLRERAALLKSLEAQLAELPPDSRTKVLESLKTIRTSMKDLEAALGRDPSNALLQELLVNTYQDEMRVLTAVHEASSAGKGI